MKQDNHSALPQGRDIPFLLLGIIGIGTSGPLIAKSTMPVPTLVFWRNFVGAIVMSPFALRNREWRDPAKRRLVGHSALAGVFLAFHFLAFFLAMRFTTVAAGTALAALQPIFAATYVRFKGEHISTTSLVGMFVAFGSVFVITGVDFALSIRAFIGDLFGLGCAVLAATYVGIGSRVQRNLATSTYTTICYGACALTVLPFILFGKMQFVHFSRGEWFLLGLLIIGAQFMGHTLFNLVLKRVSPVVVSLIVFFEVPVAAIVAWIWLKQSPSAGLYVGILGILIGCTIFVVGGKR
ncbi:MAG: DMT family transporter [Actinomycetes bacterium]